MFKLRWYQEEAKEALLTYNYASNPILALPTATGKSVIIGAFIKAVMEQYPTTRIMMLTHVKELIAQNAHKLSSMWEYAPLGIFSAGLGEKNAYMPITFGGVQSVIKYIEKCKAENREHFGFINLLIVDEAHLISEKDETTYRRVIQYLEEVNPDIKVIGLTATPYRMKGGMLTDCGIFGEVIYDLCQPEMFTRLIKEGYLSRLINRKTSFEIDTSEVAVIGGDFNLKELAQVTDKEELTFNAVQETVRCGLSQNRKSWIVFGTSIEHCEHLVKMFEQFGINAAAVHSKRKGKENDAIINAFKTGEIQCLVNNDKLTTGFDHPEIDLICVLRATKSTSLWVQMIGRGLRVAPNKKDCLVLDYGGNTKRLGAINDPVLPSKAKKGRGGTGEAPIKICPVCECYNHAAARVCEVCGSEFAFDTGLTKQASNLDLIKEVDEVKFDTETFKVDNVYYEEYKAKSGNITLRVSYLCGINIYHEYLGFETGGALRQRAITWWAQRSKEPCPSTVREALRQVYALKRPVAINVRLNDKYPEITSVIF